MIAVFHLEKFLKFFIHEHNNGAEGYIHKVVYKEASVKRDESFMFGHGFDELSRGNPLVFGAVDLETLFDDFGRGHYWVMEKWGQNADEGKAVAVVVVFAFEDLFGFLVDGEVNCMGGDAAHGQDGRAGVKVFKAASFVDVLHDLSEAELAARLAVGLYVVKR